MKNVKSSIKDILYLVNMVDFAIIYLAILLIMYLAGYQIAISICVSYVYTAFYYITKRIVCGLPVSFVAIFAIFVGGILLLPGSILMLLSLFA
tara:strand:- start:8764 stop:9042 length:279 start_codon:yes stop_codon:yes gene_type:complete